MSKIKVELNSTGIRDLLKSGEMAAAVSAVAGYVQSRCGNDYATDSYQTPSRVVSSVFTDSAEAAKDNIENNTLLKAVSG